MRDDHLRLEDILYAITQIEKYTSEGRAAYDSDEPIKSGCFITSK